jgi:threonine aldolase
LRALAEWAPSNDEVDLYGERALAERLEARVAELLGKEAAVWMPSGTMAQQIASATSQRPKFPACRRPS